MELDGSKTDVGSGQEFFVSILTWKCLYRLAIIQPVFQAEKFAIISEELLESDSKSKFICSDSQDSSRLATQCHIRLEQLTPGHKKGSNTVEVPTLYVSIIYCGTTFKHAANQKSLLSTSIGKLQSYLKKKQTYIASDLNGSMARSLLTLLSKELV